MKVSFIVPCRDKAAFVERTVKTVLDQSYSPMEIVLSDQGSVDGSYEIMKRLAKQYKGPNKVRVLKCPHTQAKGMAGLNQHLNWLHTKIDGDIVIMCSADDLNHPDRVKHTVEAFQKHNPSYVGTKVQYLNDKYELEGITNVHEDGFIDPAKNVQELIGSSASSAWSRDLYEKYGPLNGIESQDVLLPFFATMERGLYYVSEALHAYVKHADEGNTGLEGVMRAAQKKAEEAVDDTAKAIAMGPVHASVETVNYHCTSNYFAILRRLEMMKCEISISLYEALMKKAVEAANMWAVARDNITMLRIEPRPVRA